MWWCMLVSCPLLVNTGEWWWLVLKPAPGVWPVAECYIGATGICPDLAM